MKKPFPDSKIIVPKITYNSVERSAILSTGSIFLGRRATTRSGSALSGVHKFTIRCIPTSSIEVNLFGA